MPRVKRSESGGFLLPINNAEITRVRFDVSGAELSLNWDSAELTIGSETFASLRLLWPGVDQWFSLIGRRVSRAEASESGDLDLDIDDGRKLRIEHHPKYEAWQFTDKEGAIVVSVPGGDITYWDD
jgi:hypothetical protein